MNKKIRIASFFLCATYNLHSLSFLNDAYHKFTGVTAQNLGRAAEKDDAKAIREIVGAGISVDDRSGSGMTPLMRAAELGNIEATQELVRLGADVNLIGDGKTALMWAAHGSELEPTNLGQEQQKRLAAEVAALVHLGADINARGEGFKTALIVAVQGLNIPVCKELVRLGADVNAKDNQGNTALDYAYKIQFMGRYVIISILLAAGAQPTENLLKEAKKDQELIEIMKATNAIQAEMIREGYQAEESNRDVKINPLAHIISGYAAMPLTEDEFKELRGRQEVDAKKNITADLDVEMKHRHEDEYSSVPNPKKRKVDGLRD